MAAALKITREEARLRQDPFRRNAYLIIKTMLTLNSQCPSELVDEVLHSIFFLGKINTPPYRPEDIVTDDDILNALMSCYPEPFNHYSSQLPKRSPISCVLDMIVLLTGQENEMEIRQQLQRLILQLKQNNTKNILVSSTICVSQRDESQTSVIFHNHEACISKRYCMGITVALCCLQIVLLTGQKNENEIKQKLQELICQLKKDEATDLVSNTICVSQRDESQTSVRYYGVSMSTSGRNPGRIIVAAACLSNWDSYIADAVMTYDSKKEKKEYFDGTIKLPRTVRCQAFSLSDGRPMPPCGSCGNLFGLNTNDTKLWAYGNCAEVESLSNLLKNEKEVREQVETKRDKSTDVERKRARESVKKVLEGNVKMVNFEWNEMFYTQQAVLP